MELTVNKQEWLEEAIEHIDSLNTDEFEEFLLSCTSRNIVITNYTDIQHGKCIVISKAANMDSYYAENISLAA